MRNRHQESRPSMTCAFLVISVINYLKTFSGLEMDVRTLQFEDASFDVAIDKGQEEFASLLLLDFGFPRSGTMDAMMTTKGDIWDPPEEVINNCNSEVDETVR